MSWFDSVGIANFAKTALKEAQKQIDKALDINDEDGGKGAVVVESQRKLSKTEPSTPQETMKQSNSTPALSSSVWGSFSGSFFESPTTEKQETVTTPPTSLKRIEEYPGQQTNSRLSSESESLEILSNPTTPGSNLTSPGGGQLSISTILQSDSVEILGFCTPTSENFSSTDSSSVIPSNINSPSSVEVISEELLDDDGDIHKDLNVLEDDEEEDDSISYNTISDTITAVTIVEPTTTLDKGIITTPPSRSSLHLSLGTFNISNISDGSNESERTIEEKPPQISTKNMLEDAMLERSIESFDAATQLSDSTQSFEDVNPGNLISLSYHRHHEQPPDNSPPLSTDSKNSDIVKICSSQTSGHTSGDEIETATSSDIEIISSPNGDSSSTNSMYRISPKTGCVTSSMMAKARGFEILGNTGDGKIVFCQEKKSMIFVFSVGFVNFMFICMLLVLESYLLDVYEIPKYSRRY